MLRPAILTVSGLFFAGFLMLVVLPTPRMGTVKAQPRGTARAQPVETVIAKRETVQVLVESVGTIRAAERTVVTGQATGTVSGIHFEDGQAVRAGDLLITLDKTEQEAAVRLAEVVRDGAQRDLARAQNLVANNAIARERVDDLRTSYESAEARLQTAQAQLDKRFIRAPFSGRLGLRQVSLGALVTPGTPITYLQSADAAEVVFTVPEGSVRDVRIGQNVRAYPARDRAVRIVGRVTSIDSRIDPATRSVTIIARLTNGTAIKPGTFVNVELVVDRRMNVRVPEEALFYEGARTYAFLVQEGKAVLREVTVGQRADGKVEILAGVTSGDEVISSGIQKVRDGAPVQPRPRGGQR